MTARESKISELKETWMEAERKKHELMHEVWKVETIANNAKEKLMKYGEEDFLGVVPETTTMD